jgi:hypothetical protein
MLMKISSTFGFFFIEPTAFYFRTILVSFLFFKLRIFEKSL